MRHTYYDFFAGGGMVGVGLEPAWRCRFANEIDPTKAASYRVNHGGGRELLVGDVAQVAVDEIPGSADLAWASFPCQDLSRAGNGAGLSGRRSGLFRPFWSLMEGLHAQGRGPRIITLENVCGAITARGGRDFVTLVQAFCALGYRCGAVVVDAVHFLPQSRPRLFVIGVREDLTMSETLVQDGPTPAWHPPALVAGHALLTPAAKARWLWWRLPMPPVRAVTLGDLIGEGPAEGVWHTADETARLLGLMTALNLRKVEAALAGKTPSVGAVYRRTRPDGAGGKRQRAEVRFDGIAGCLRTPAGGSSRQTILVVEDGAVRTRLLAPREAAALMGLPADYVLPARDGDAYKLAGDGVAVPVVRHLAAAIFEPALAHARLELVARTPAASDFILA